MNKTILLVEDNPDDEALTLRAVRKHMPYGIVVARDGAEALDYLFGTGNHSERDSLANPLLVLLDLKLPKVNGLEVLRRMRENCKTRSIPVIVFTSSTEEQDILDSYRLGANSYIRKPVDYGQFCDNMKQVMTYWLSVNQLPPQRNCAAA
ncbi:response regulator, putative [Citrifermentans bemidjiense Bem]|uniref:Response regulator, putative n=1 Tax=Citrifermentans bemidjiense (strain ATCC BAA-1014 / DSM 16622 / JCM 12645 / Bem) TaxID=404380 RepID=B5E943_CITBB|nr:response regulator [Citrifermentans bemidjiense]ACH37180.1 response regulator, putative [Citrifermentans bemidjiense Bem]